MGFFISKTHGFLGASPDRIVHDLTEETPGVAEFKFIQVKDGETLSGVLIKQHICVKPQGGSFTLQLNRNHKYFYQLYHQMFVTDFHWGIFIAALMVAYFMKKLSLIETSGCLYWKN